MLSITSSRLGSFRLLAALIAAAIVAPATSQTWVRFAIIGDYGKASQPELDVSNLIHSWYPHLIITVGDNNYESGADSTIDANIGQYYHDFIFPYTGAYGAGSATNKFFPCLGNHDWVAAGATPYLNYFQLPGIERYYSLPNGPVELFCVDSDPNEPSGTASNSVQGVWLQNAMSQSSATWKIPYFHHAPYSSGQHQSTTYMRWPFATWGADVVLSGHDHTYERVLQNGIPYIVNGLGGKSIYSFGTIVAGSQFRYNSDYGAMLADASDDALTLSFITRTGIYVESLTLTANNAVVPTTVTAFRGSITGGRITDAYYSNDYNLHCRPGATLVSSEAPLQLIFEGTSALQTPSNLQFTLEGSASAGVLQQVVSLYNFSTLAYDALDSRLATTSDSTVDVNVSTNAWQYVEPGTKKVRSRITWKATAPVLIWPWLVRVDLALWHATP